MYVWLLEPDQISHTQSMLAKERPQKPGKPSHPYVKKGHFKTQHDRIPIDPAILAAIGHGFIAEKKRKVKMPTRLSNSLI